MPLKFPGRSRRPLAASHAPPSTSYRNTLPSPLRNHAPSSISKGTREEVERPDGLRGTAGAGIVEEPRSPSGPPLLGPPLPGPLVLDRDFIRSIPSLTLEPSRGLPTEIALTTPLRSAPACARPHSVRYVSSTCQ